MSTRRQSVGLRNECSQPQPCLSLSKLRKKTKSKLCLGNGDNSSKKDLSPNISSFSGCSETAVISFGCDEVLDSISETTKKDRLNEFDDIEDCEYSCSRQAPILDNKVNKIDQETQTDPPRNVYTRRIIGLVIILSSVFFCFINVDFLHILRGLHVGYFSRPDSADTLLIDTGTCDNHGKVAQPLVLQDMAQLQAKVENMEKALVLLQLPEFMLSNRAADKMLEHLYGPVPDYALEATGGSILETPNTEIYSTQTSGKTFGLDFWNDVTVTSNPRLLIQGLIQPGECWAFKGTVGSVTIQLSRRIRVSSITLEHFPDYLLPSGTTKLSAPRLFSVMAVPDCDSCKPMHLGLYEYNLYGPARQTFLVNRELFESVPAVKIVELHFTANHGNPIFTCVYRVRIHGEPQNN